MWCSDLWSDFYNLTTVSLNKSSSHRKFYFRVPPKMWANCSHDCFSAKNTQPFSLQTQVFMPHPFLGPRLVRPWQGVHPPNLPHISGTNRATVMFHPPKEPYWKPLSNGMLYFYVAQMVLELLAKNRAKLRVESPQFKERMLRVFLNFFFRRCFRKPGYLGEKRALP